MSVSPRSEVHISHDDSEGLVTNVEEAEDAPTAETTAPATGAQQPPTLIASPSFFGSLFQRRPTETSNVTERRARDPERRSIVEGAAQITLPTEDNTLRDRRIQLANLQLDADMADAMARRATAEETAARCLKSAAELRLETQALEDTHRARSRPPSTSSQDSQPETQHPVPARPRSISPAAALDLSIILGHLQDTQQRADEQRREDRREDRREAAELQREARREAAEQLARMEARHQALWAELMAGRQPINPPVDVSFAPNKGLADFPPFSGKGQDLHLWLQQFRAKAKFLHLSEKQIVRELCLKLSGDALVSYSQVFGEANPTFGAVVALLAKEFILPYQGATLWSAYYRYKRKAGSSGKEVQRDLLNARQAMLDDGIPVDNLSPDEVKFYIYLLALSSAQSSQFLATLSSNSGASDDYLRSLTPTTEGDRRVSVEGPTNSAERTACFGLRVTLIEAFLDHDHGNSDQGGKARVAAADGTLDDAPGSPGIRDPRGTDGGPAPSIGGPLPSISELECRLRVARADRIMAAKGNGQPLSAPLPPPEYRGTNDKHEAANKAEFVKRRDCGACFACLMKDVQYDLPFTMCPQHGLGTTSLQRKDNARRVKGAAGPGGRY